MGFKFWEDDDGESTEEVRHVDVNHSVDVIERKKKKSAFVESKTHFWMA